MKNALVLSLLLAVPALAGTTQQVTRTDYSPPPQEQGAWNWFVGATGGYLLDAEEPMYTVQLGAKSPWAFGGWSVALYAEAGWTERDFQTDTLLLGDEDGELDIVPLTFNVKLERLLVGDLSAYVGGGVGAAYIDAELDSPFNDNDDSENDWVFTAQVFAGLAYHVSDSFEIFGGARWIYFEDPDVAVSLDDDFLIEGGLRFHF